ncbi:hypothetical protein PM082_022677 [Marasmius tenuissimus]|nr:hypothetical protein PM082_022677 [Marasmius tenuissimus]
MEGKHDNYFTNGVVRTESKAIDVYAVQSNNSVRIHPSINNIASTGWFCGAGFHRLDMKSPSLRYSMYSDESSSLSTVNTTIALLKKPLDTGSLLGYVNASLLPTSSVFSNEARGEVWRLESNTLTPLSGCGPGVDDRGGHWAGCKRDGVIARIHT